MSVAAALQQLSSGHDLDSAMMANAMHEIMSGQANAAQVGAMLMGLVVKGETTEELTAAAQVMREFAESVQVSGKYVLDTCGTGGDTKGLFNVSTACAFVCAEAGVKVAKHGNRSVSSTTGSADVLEAAGLNLDLTPQQVGQCIEELNIGFLFAQKHHPAMRHVTAIRKSLGIRTLFNLLGPLTSPANAPCQLLGVFDQRWLVPVAETLRALGSRHVLVVHAEDGLDEISIAAPTRVAELCNGEITEYTIDPANYLGMRLSLEPLVVKEATASLQLISEALKGKTGSAGAMLAINSGAALYAADRVKDIRSGVDLAQYILASGKAWSRLEALVQRSQELANS